MKRVEKYSFPYPYQNGLSDEFHRAHPYPRHRTWRERLALIVFSDEFLIVVGMSILAAAVLAVLWLVGWAVRWAGIGPS